LIISRAFRIFSLVIIVLFVFKSIKQSAMLVIIWQKPKPTPCPSYRDLVDKSG
jgi:hypothetical protein